MVRLKFRYLLLNILYPEDGMGRRNPLSTPAYLQFHNTTPQYVTPKDFVDYLKSQIGALFGDHGVGVSTSSLKLVYFSHATSTAILRVPRNHFRLTWAALAHMTELPRPRGAQQTRFKCVIRVVRVSGTIKKAEEELLRRSRRDIVRAKMAGQDQETAVLDKFTATSSDVLMPRELELPAVQDDDSSSGVESTSE